MLLTADFSITQRILAEDYIFCDKNKRVCQPVMVAIFPRGLVVQTSKDISDSLFVPCCIINIIANVVASSLATPLQHAITILENYAPQKLGHMTMTKRICERHYSVTCSGRKIKYLKTVE